MLKRMALLIISFMLSLSFCAAFGENPPQKVTLMVYMCGTSYESLHGALSASLAGLQAAEYDDREINVIIMTGGAKTWHNQVLSQMTEIHRIRHLHLVRVHGLTIRAMDETAIVPQMETEWYEGGWNMGDPGTLSMFLCYGVESYPAQEYGLMMISGRSSPNTGFGADEIFDDDTLTLEELGIALRNSPFSEDNRLTWVGFDASLMGNLETADQLVPYARYLIADEGLMYITTQSIPFFLLEALGKGLSGREASIRAASDYVDSAEGLEGIPMVAVSCVDLAAIEPVVQARNALFAELREQYPAWFGNILFRVLMEAEIDSPLRIWQEYNLFDLRLICRECEALVPEAAASLQAALDRAVLYSGGNEVGAIGLSTCS